MHKGPTNLITDVAGLTVGQAEDPGLKSGVTTVVGDRPFVAGVSVMGGAPGTRETDLLAPDKWVKEVDALVLSGGSAFGLDAAGGVMAGLREDGRGFEVGPAKVPLAPAAIIFDLLNGGDKDWVDNPYPALGKSAYANRGKDLQLGSHGAGTGAIAGDIKGGVGSASLVLDSGITVGALVVVNALGSPCAEGGGHFWAAPWEVEGEFGGLGLPEAFRPLTSPHLPKLNIANGGNTTIAIVATDAPLHKSGCLRMATAAQDGMGRALVPAHTPFDGDLVFGVSTGCWQGSSTREDPIMIGHAASICLARAIARGVYEATPAPHDPMPCFQSLRKD